MRVYNLTDHRILVEATPGKLTRVGAGKSLDLPPEDAHRVLSANPFLSGHKDGQAGVVPWEDKNESRRRGDAGPVVDPPAAVSVDGMPVVVTPGGDGTPGNPDGTTYAPHEVDYAAIAAELKGEALDLALVSAGLPKSGSADEKRDRYAAFIREANAPADDAPAEVLEEGQELPAEDPEDGGPDTNDAEKG